jgi:hypothetical protein
MVRKTRPVRKPSRRAIIRAVASSTAIETGLPVRQLEKLLRVGRTGSTSARLRSLSLAE